MADPEDLYHSLIEASIQQAGSPFDGTHAYLDDSLEPLLQRRVRMRRSRTPGEADRVAARSDSK